MAKSSSRATTPRSVNTKSNPNRSSHRGGGGMYRSRGREEDYYDEEDYRSMARGRSGGSSRGRGRY